MSLFDTVLSNTLGPFWRAGTGTVDPWTKRAIIDDAADDLVKASIPVGSNQPTVSKEQAVQEQTQLVTEVLTSYRDGTVDAQGNPIGADPTQAVLGLQHSLKLAGDYGTEFGKTVLYIGIGVALVYGTYLLWETGALKGLLKKS